LQLTYAMDRVTFSPYLVKLREQVKQDSIQKIEESRKAE
jgi:hypothetical protein